jgi:2-methylisocitrate lyase-like PEP mutase family enzyme
MENETLVKYQAFKALHEDTFVMPNPWDAGTARILTALGYKALATTSAGYAFSQGKKDSARCLGRDDILGNARAIMQATDLPVSADLENGFGDAPETCAQTIRAASEAGLVGGSIEDATGNADTPIYDFSHAVERVTAAVEAARGLPFMVTARAENFLHDRPDLDDTIKRLQAFEAAGADVLFAPGLRDLAAIRAVCAAVSKPVNVVMGLSGPSITVDELRAAGVTRISVGGSFARAALGGFLRAAQEVLTTGSFEYAKVALPDAVASGYMASDPAE